MMFLIFIWHQDKPNWNELNMDSEIMKLIWYINQKDL